MGIFIIATSSTTANVPAAFTTKGMKHLFLSLGLAAVLIACGGGGSSGGGNSGGSSAAADIGTIPELNNGNIADINSGAYAHALRAIAEMEVALVFTISLHDLLTFMGNSGSCYGGGTLSYVEPVQTMTTCMRKFPTSGTYTGSYSGTSNAATGIVSVTAVGGDGVKMYKREKVSELEYTLLGGSFAGKKAREGLQKSAL